jgi:hypothetical protein
MALNARNYGLKLDLNNGSARDSVQAEQAAYESHPLAAAFPLMEGEDYSSLVADIREHGLCEPILLHEGLVLDGRNRLRACIDAGIRPRFVHYAGDDPVTYVISLNLRRRHLDSSQRAMIAARLATLKLGANQHTKAGAGIQAPSQTQAADLLKVSRDSVQKGRLVLNHGTEELQRAVEAGRLAVSVAADLALAHPNWQIRVLALTPDEIIEEAKRLRRERYVAKVSKRCSTSRADLFAGLEIDVPVGEKERFDAIIKAGIDAIQYIDKLMASVIWSLKVRGKARKEGFGYYLEEVRGMPARIEKLLSEFESTVDQASEPRSSDSAEHGAGQGAGANV